MDGTNSRTEDLLVTGVEETKKPLSRVEAILRGEDVKPLSRIEKALKEGGGSGSEQIMFINGEASQDKSHVTLNKTFAEIYDFVKNNNKIAVIIVPNLVFSGNNYFMLSGHDDASSSFPALLNFSYIGNRVEIDSVRSQLTFKEVRLAIDSTEDNIARVINDSNTTPLYVEISGTLLAGETNLAITNGHIKTTSTIDYYTSIFGVNPTKAVVTSGRIVLTFEAQQTDMQVKVRVS